MKVYEKTCHVCGKTYETTHRSQRYCDECKRLGRHPPKKCRICGRPSNLVGAGTPGFSHGEERRLPPI